MKERRDSGLDEYMKRGIRGVEGFRTKGIQGKRDTGKEGKGQEGSGQNACGTEGMQER